MPYVNFFEKSYINPLTSLYKPAIMAITKDIGVCETYILMKGGCVFVDIRKYDIVEVDFGEPVGSEQGGKRPAVVVQNDKGNIHSNTTLVMALSSKIKNINQPTHTLIKKSRDNGLKTDSMLLGEQTRVISAQRIVCKYGTITDENERREIRRVYFANFGE